MRRSLLNAGAKGHRNESGDGSLGDLEDASGDYCPGASRGDLEDVLGDYCPGASRDCHCVSTRIVWPLAYGEVVMTNA